MTNEKGYVMIVEDEEVIRKPLKIYLENVGYYVKSHERYEDAIPIGYIDAYILDKNNKYGMDGDEWIKENEMFVPVTKRILMSGNDAWLKTGIESRIVLSKPFRLNNIETILDVMKNEK